MNIIGLTGSIASGKSAIAALCARLGLGIFDADRAAHRLLAPGGKAARVVSVAFPGAAKEGQIDRAALGAIVFADAGARKKLEAILHPMIADEMEGFLKRQRLKGVRTVILEVPLLFETGFEAYCDSIFVTLCPDFLRERRALARPGMTKARFRAIDNEQLPQEKKAQWADFVIHTGLGRGYAMRELKRGLKHVANHQRNRG